MLLKYIGGDFMNKSQKCRSVLRYLKNDILYFSPRNSDNRKAEYYYTLRARYEDYPLKKLKGILVDYAVSIKKNELAATGIFGLLFSALLSGLGKSTLKWIQTVMELYVLKLTNVKTVPKEYIMKTNIFSGVLVFLVIVIIGLLLYLVIAYISHKRRIYLVIRDIIKDKENE